MTPLRYIWLFALFSHAALAQELPDRLLATVNEDAAWTLLIPRLRNVAEPAVGLADRLGDDPLLSQGVDALRRSVAAKGLDLFDLRAHQHAGLNLDGLVFATASPTGIRLRLPLPTQEAALDYLGALGLPAQRDGAAIKLGSRRGELKDGGLVISESAAPTPRPERVAAQLAQCAAAPGEADLFLWFRYQTEALGQSQGCLTLRFDPGQLQARLSITGPTAAQAKRLLAPLSPALRAGVTEGQSGFIALALTEEALSQLAARAPDPAQATLLSALNGELLVLAGDGTEFEARLGLKPGRSVPLSSFAALLTQKGLAPAPIPGGFEVPLSPKGPLSKVLVRLVQRGDALVLSTRQRPPPASAPRADLEGAGLALWLPLKGGPLDGQIFADAATTLGLTVPGSLVQVSRTFAFLLAHLGELSLKVTPAPKGAALSLEVGLL